MKIRCESCRGEFEIDGLQAERAADGKVECLHCGAPVAVGKAVRPTAAAQPAPARAEAAEAGPGEYERLLADICEPDGPDLRLADAVAFRKEVPRRVRPATFPRKAPPAAAAPIESLPEVLPADVTPVDPRPAPVDPRPAPVDPRPAPARPAVAPAASAPAAAPGAVPVSAPAAGAAPARTKEAAAPRQKEEPPRPKEPARPARTIPNYTVSRSVTLDPELLLENRCAAFFPEAPELEPYRVIRTQILQAAAEKGGNTVMITSALPQEGKTLTAINLALTFSKAYLETALLVDCDLRQQRVKDILGYDSDKGLGDYLAGDCTVPDMMAWPGVEKLTVVSGGRTVSGSSELLGSPAMKALVEDMKSRYPNRYVFFDVPPVLSGADALVFAPLVDHILFVVRAGATPVAEVRRALEMLPREKVVGLVLNRQART
jgi:non-specific protein-tyrosine kinase